MYCFGKLKFQPSLPLPYPYIWATLQCSTDFVNMHALSRAVEKCRRIINLECRGPRQRLADPPFPPMSDISFRSTSVQTQGCPPRSCHPFLLLCSYLVSSEIPTWISLWESWQGVHCILQFLSSGCALDLCRLHPELSGAWENKSRPSGQAQSAQ